MAMKTCGCLVSLNVDAQKKGVFDEKRKSPESVGIQGFWSC